MEHACTEKTTEKCFENSACVKSSIGTKYCTNDKICEQ